ncbi:MAG: vacuolar iron transporter family protein [Acidimicrobiaceae bacterium]|jgi:VIT1/CCC1 family predicted Fe2+/Mn2+ transporter|nr:vacuolar iron transporter family protein [Acidimicrobiaceae bacterium]MDQ1370444.1 vacuolar iron transporter family protein [Acidimicrobiaceae bacterium]MDQ1378902.1 vacuolar iron transporter family protein [Acidimicrobiaceae bacterium]MDQ1398979.1 vacuolar iron transporter family protein [Acidimicrobiaceae bacterium]MDQ1411603.1 vacuolar iron transporter family protein [Acidimicrobiaceae bacterium]
MTAPSASSTPRTLPEPPESHHRDIQGGAARAAVLGVSDGLVTNVSLILGVAGANTAPGTIRLAGLAGLLAGAFSMAAGEYVSMKAQSELLERELEMEALELRRSPDAERAELAQLYESRGVDPDIAGELANEMMRTPELALETHAREELGVDPSSLGNPYQAAFASAGSFAVGALVPLMPWFFASGVVAVMLSLVLGAAAAIMIGSALARYTGRSALRSSVRQLVVTVAAASVTYGLGALVGTSLT